MLNYVTVSFPGMRDFTFEGSVTGLNYWYLVRKRKEIKFGRIDIVVQNGNKRDIEVVGLDSNVVHIHLYMDIGNYQKNDRQVRVKLLYEMIFYAMDYLCGRMGWDKDFYNSVAQEIVDKDFSFEIVLFPKTKNKARNHIAEFVVQLNPEMAEFRTNVYGGDGSFQKAVVVYQSYPHILFYARFFSKGAWTSNDIYSITDTEKEIYFDCNVVKGEVNIRLDPKVNTVDELNDLLKGLKFDTPDEDRPRLLQLPRVLPH